jgi:hypothetical protein
MMLPSPRQKELLQKAANSYPWQKLEVHEICGVAAPTISDIPRMERAALADPDVLLCEKNGWLIQRSSHMRDPMFWWNITESGLLALANAVAAEAEE